MAGSPSSREGRVPGALGGSAALPTPSLQAPRGVLTVRRCLSGLPRHPRVALVRQPGDPCACIGGATLRHATDDNPVSSLPASGRTW